MNENYIVKKSNYFIMNSNYDLSLEEQKIILTLASMVQLNDEEFKPYKFKISDFMELVGVEDKSKYTEVPKITKELMKKVFEIQEGNKVIQTAWLSGAVYEKGTGYVELTFSPYLKPYMLKLSSMFTQYKLANILSMRSKYSPRIYELLKCNEFKQQKYIEIEIEELRKLLKADNIYPLYADFKRKIILTTQKELNKLTDISFDFEEVKTGRKVTSIRFYIKSKNNFKDQKVIQQIEITAAESFQDEMAITDEHNAIQSDEEIVRQANLIMQVQRIIREDISQLEAKKILLAASDDVDIIKEKYKIAMRTTGIKNIVAWLISAIKEGYKEPKNGECKHSFNDYQQRTYDGSDGGMTLDEIERKLLGWDNTDPSEEETYRGIDEILKKEIIEENEDNSKMTGMQRAFRSLKAKK